VAHRHVDVIAGLAREKLRLAKRIDQPVRVQAEAVGFHKAIEWGNRRCREQLLNTLHELSVSIIYFEYAAGALPGQIQPSFWIEAIPRNRDIRRRGDVHDSKGDRSLARGKHQVAHTLANLCTKAHCITKATN